MTTIDRVAPASPMTREEKLELLRLLEEKRARTEGNKLKLFYPDTGPLRRELYPKHMEFFRAGRDYRERCAIAANRVGKTEGMGGYETALHLTGQYPDWWEGRVFRTAVDGWAAGKSNETTRDIIQRKLFGPTRYVEGVKGLAGTGLVPRDCIGRITWKQGFADLVDTVQIKHTTGDWSVLGLKSYEQGRKSFEGTEKHLIWLDEECSMDVYGECVIRTATTDGLVYATFTPMEGATEVVLSFLTPEALNAQIEALKAEEAAGHLGVI